MDLITELYERVVWYMPMTLLFMLTTWEMYLLNTKNWTVRVTTLFLFYSYLYFLVLTFGKVVSL